MVSIVLFLIGRCPLMRRFNGERICDTEESATTVENAFAELTSNGWGGRRTILFYDYIYIGDVRGMFVA